MAERASLARLEKEYNVEIDWRGFELHPETPAGGLDLSKRHRESKGPDMGAYIRQFAANFGITDMKSSGRLPNTRRALAVAEYARDNGKLEEFRTLAMDAHWKERKDIEDESVLRELASEAGLDPEQALAATENARYLKRVDEIRVEFKQLGVGGIPTFVYDGEIIEGCRPYEDIEAAAVRAGAVSV